MADFLIVDVGGADLAVEIDTDGASLQFDRSGVSEEDADDGSKLVVVGYDVRRIASLKSKWLTTEEFQALVAASKNGLEPILIGGHLIRTTTPNTVPQTMSAILEVSSADYFADDDDFLHVAQINIRESLA